MPYQKEKLWAIGIHMYSNTWKEKHQKQVKFIKHLRLSTGIAEIRDIMVLPPERISKDFAI